MFDAPASRHEIEKAGFALVNERNVTYYRAAIRAVGWQGPT